MPFNNRTSTGIFIPDGNGFRQAPAEAAGRSLNGCAEYLGYHPDQVLFYLPDNYSRGKISNIAFEIFTRNIIFITTDNKTTFLTTRDIRKALEGFSVTKYYTSLEIMQILETGIENESLTVDYLADVLKLNNISRNGMFYSSKIKTYLYFTNGLLTNFQYDDGFSSRAKELKQVNKTVYEILAKAAFRYRAGNDFQAQKEINIQAEAWSSIPDAFGNQYIPLHTYDGGAVNLHMIRVCHYNHPITLKAFQELNYGRFIVVSHSTIDGVVLRLGRFDYHFYPIGDLDKSWLN